MIYFALFLILFEAIPEGLADSGRKRIAGLLEFIYLAVVTVSIFLWICNINIPVSMQGDMLGYGLLGYIFLRFAIFDYIYNLAVGQGLGFIGSTKFYDRILSKIITVGKVQLNLLHFVKFIFLCIGITFLLKN